MDYRDLQLDSFLEQGERTNVVTSIFDESEPVEDLEVEPISKGGTWHKIGDTEFYVRRGE